MYSRNRCSRGIGLTDQKRENLSETAFQRGFALLCPFCFGLLERETSHEPAFAGIFANFCLHPLTPWKGATWGRSWRISFSVPSKAPLIKGRLGGIVYMVAELFPRNAQKKDSFLLSFVRWAENETLSICSPLCISSNYLCPVLYSQFEGHLGSFKVSFSSPTFAIQTSELQLLTTNLRIIFELTKSKRDGLYL